jgi:murein DD-endopeptidase MepM/ murein hydrolase activator NlpD
MPNQPYFVVVLAHSLHGRLRRIHIPHQAIYAVVVLAIIGFFSVSGFLLSYARMTWKVARYNNLRQEVEVLRLRYRELRKVSNQKSEELATLQLFANEVSVAYGLDTKSSAPHSHASDPALLPSYRESLQEFSLLQNASFSPGLSQMARQWQTNLMPSLWPLNGRLLSPFGVRTDPFSGEGATHTGVDISAGTGTPVHVTADGIVSFTGWMSGYGKLVMVQHDNNLRTYYAHLSSFEVMPGQEVRRGEEIARSGASGRATAPHLHYEVRIGGVPVNPYKYLSHSPLAVAHASRDVSLF